MKPVSIVVVEDEKLIARGIEKRLKMMGYEVAALAHSGEEGIQKVRENHPDLVLMDINLGSGIDGIEAADVIRKEMHYPVVFLTAHSDAATIRRARLTEPFGYVLKPYDEKELQTAIEIGLYKHGMEKRLRESEEWLGSTLGSIVDGVIATDETGRVRFVNPLAKSLTGSEIMEVQEVSVQDIFEVIEEKSRTPIPNLALAALASGQPEILPDRCVLLGKDGVERPIDAKASPIRDGAGRLTGAVLVFQDVSKRRSLEQQVEEQQRILMEANQRLEALASTDALTQTNNRRAFNDKLTQEVTRAKRVPLPLSLMLLDVDHFKAFNDTFGHPAGDEVLKMVARLMLSTVRITDFVARYGGEEFAVLLPNTDEEGGVVIAERVRQAIAEFEWERRAITVSIGVSTLNAKIDQENALVKSADAALYQSKGNGRNRVTHWGRMETAGAAL